MRGVVPFGMFIIYLPSISAVTRRRFTGRPFPPSVDSLDATGWKTHFNI